jgi:hypothetical protein
VPFGKNHLVVLVFDGGEKFLSISEPCRQLGLDYEQQVRWIQARWGGADWRQEEVSGRRTFFLAKRRVVGWLNRVRPEDCPSSAHKQALLYWQDHCDEVLNRYFDGVAEAPASADPSDPLEVALAQTRAIVLILERQRATQGQVAVLERRVDAIDVRSAAAAVSLAADADEEAPAGLTLRAKLNRRVRTFAEGRQVDYADVWGLLYRDLRDRYRFDAQGRARHAGTVALDEVERAGMLPQLWRIACHKLK